MANKVLDILVDIEASGVKALDKASKSFDKFDKSIVGSQKSLKSFAEGSSKLASKLTPAVVGLSAITAGFAAVTKATLSTADAIAKTADKVGFTTDALQELRVAASLTGVSQGNLEAGLQRFSRGVAEAANGTGTLVKNLEQYGVSVTNKNGKLKSSNQLLNEYANVIKNAENDQERLRLATDAFGRSGADLVLTLKNGSAGLEAMRQKARDLGIVIDENLLRGAESANDAMDLLTRSLKANFQTVILQLAPQIQSIAESLIGFIPIITQVLTSLGPMLPAIVAIVGGLTTFGIAFITIINPIIQFIAFIAPVVAAIGSFIAALGGIIPIAIAVGVALAALVIALNFEEIIGFLTDSLQTAYEFWSEIFDSFLETLSSIVASVSDFFASIVESFSAGIASIVEIFSGLGSAFDSAIGVITQFVGEWIGFFSYLYDQTVGTLNGIIDYVVGIVNSVISAVSRMWSAITGAQQAQANPQAAAGMSSGGPLFGYGGGDRISALLEAGEYVIRKESVKKYGRNFFNSLNSMTLPETSLRFQDGGLVPSQTNNFNYNAPITNYGGAETEAAFRKIILPEFKRALKNNSMSITSMIKKVR